MNDANNPLSKHPEDSPAPVKSEIEQLQAEALAALNRGDLAYASDLDRVIREKLQKQASNCEICKNTSCEAGQMLTPRHFTQMQVISKDVEAITLWAFARSIVTYDNPRGAKDKPMYFICSNCLARHFGIGELDATANTSTGARTSPKLKDGKPGRKWWQLW
jgi:hypothetical protein